MSHIQGMWLANIIDLVSSEICVSRATNTCSGIISFIASNLYVVELCLPTYWIWLKERKKKHPLANKFLANLQVHWGLNLNSIKSCYSGKDDTNAFSRLAELVQWTDLNEAVMEVESEHGRCIAWVLADCALHLSSHGLLRIRASALVVIQAQLWVILCPGHSAEVCQQHCCHQSQGKELSLSHCDHS